MKKQKLVYIVSDVDKALHFEWISPILQEQYNLTYILIGKERSALQNFLLERKIDVLVFPYKGKIDLAFIGFKVLKSLIRLKPEIVHTHLWVANVVGLTAAWFARVKKRIFTRHHATEHYENHPAGLKWDKLCNRLATHIIAISKNVEDILINMDGAPREKVVMIHHGFDLSFFQDVSDERVNQLRQKYALNDRRTVIGVISRFEEWKGIQFIIPAFQKIIKSFPDVHLILANAQGGYAWQINSMLADLPPKSYTKISFENDLASLYKLFDIFIHVPVNEKVEAFGQIYVEALAAGIPSVFTLSGIAPEFIEHEKNALVVDFKNSEYIYASIVRLLTEQDLKRNIISEGRIDSGAFSITAHLNRLITLYSR
jgi:glycosyltransferase involved in cell wall biosynthesis